MRPTVAQRLEDRSVPEPNSGCLLWLGCVYPNGYGQITAFGKVMKAHRAAWLAGRGPIPDGACVLHRCDQPSCVRVDHLFLGSNADNVHDCMAKGRRRTDRLTHCPAGHPYDEENTSFVRGRRRNCRACGRAWNARNPEKRAASWQAWISAHREAHNAARRAKRAAATSNITTPTAGR